MCSSGTESIGGRGKHGRVVGVFRPHSARDLRERVGSVKGEHTLRLAVVECAHERERDRGGLAFSQANERRGITT